MGVGRADQGGVGLSRQIQVIGETALAAEQARVLDPGGGLSDPELHRGAVSGRSEPRIAPRTVLLLLHAPERAAPGDRSQALARTSAAGASANLGMISSPKRRRLRVTCS